MYEVLGILNDSFGQLLIWSFFITATLIIINIFIDFFLYDLINGISISIFMGTVYSLIVGNLEINKQLLLYIIISFACCSIAYIFVYKYVAKNSERSNLITDKDLIGDKAYVTVTIPKDGYGEVMITKSMQRITKTAVLYNSINSDNVSEIKSGTEVRIMDYNNGILEVSIDNIITLDDLVRLGS